jgi:hypothetical protein
VSTTVAVGDYTVTSTHESAADMAEALKPEKAETTEARVITDKGKKVAEEPEKDSVSKAAAELGKKGGEAAAKARAKAEREAKRDAKAADARDSRSGDAAAGEEPADEAEEAEGAEAAEESQAAKDARKGNPRHDLQARVQQLAEQRRAAEERAARAERELEAERRARQSAPPAGTAQGTPASGQDARSAESEKLPQGFPPKPVVEDFDTYEEWLDARDEWRDALRDHRSREAEVSYRRGEAIHNRKMAFAQAFTKAAEADATFRDRITPEVTGLEVSAAVIERNERPSGRNWIADEMFSAPDLAPGWALYLSEHPDDLQRIAALRTPREVTRAMAKLDVRQDAATAGTSSRRSVSQANPPVTPVTGSPNTVDVPSDEDDYDTHVRKMTALEQRRRR